VAVDFQFDATPMVDRSTSCPSSMSAPASRRPSRQHASTRLTLGQVRYHPEAIMFGVAPVDSLTAIYDAAGSATHQVTGAHTGSPVRALETARDYLLQHLSSARQAHH
jgi:hypothetical protein